VTPSALPTSGRPAVVVDIGKTRLKLSVVEADGTLRHAAAADNRPDLSGPYPAHDVERTWAWLLDALSDPRVRDAGSIVVATHGATAACLGAEWLALPILDYEWDGVREFDADYDRLRPPFAESGSPALPAGLNLGRQLHWLERRHADAFAACRHILMFPQYWAWRLSGGLASEATSLGCHTDLWAPHAGGFSSLVAARDWGGRLPPLRPAWEPAGRLLPPLAARTGLGGDVRVLTGIHDSNASLLPYLQNGSVGTMVSTGTWIVVMALSGAGAPLRQSLDMLVNVDAAGRPVPCIRFMGGRELAVLAAGTDPGSATADEALALARQGVMALPGFTESGGPFLGSRGRVLGDPGAGNPAALGMLYCALMTDLCLDLLGAPGPIAIDGGFSRMPLFADLLAALRPQERVLRVSDARPGAAWLAAWPDGPGPAPAQVPATGLTRDPAAAALLAAYRQAWRAALPPLPGG